MGRVANAARTYGRMHAKLVASSRAKASRVVRLARKVGELIVAENTKF
jgi:hypothetical protein